MEGKWLTPNEAIEMAKQAMLDGRQPETEEDWAKIMNCLAYNAVPVVAEVQCQLIALICDIPLSKENISDIVTFQLHRRALDAFNDAITNCIVLK